MAGFRRISSVIDEWMKPQPKREQVVWKVAAENPEEAARRERALMAKVNQPVLGPAGNVIYKCAACRDLGFLKDNVPINHPHFGKVRVCPHREDYARWGNEWFSIGPGD